MKLFRWLAARCKKKGLHHWITLLVLLLLGTIAGQILEESPLLASTRLWLYQIELFFQFQKPTHPSHTAIVLLGDAEFWSRENAGRSPTNRALIADILNQLNAIHVQRVVLDFDLRLPQAPGLKGDYPQYATEDTTLIQAIANFCQTPGHSLVLGTSVLYDDENHWYTGVPTVDSIAPNATIKPGCLTHGYIQLPSDMRQVPESITLKYGDPLNSLALAASAAVDPTVTDRAAKHQEASFHFSRFLKPEAFGYNTKSSKPFALEGGIYDTLTPALLRDAARNPAQYDALIRNLDSKTVLVGGDWNTRAYGEGPREDQWQGPIGTMPGVFLHANYIEALLDPDSRGIFDAMSPTATKSVEIILVVVTTFLGLFEMKGHVKWAVLSTTILLTLIVLYVLLVNLGLFMDFLVPLCILILHTVFEDFLALLHEVQHLRQRSEESTP